jgi:hypothetical protein
MHDDFVNLYVTSRSTARGEKMHFQGAVLREQGQTFAVVVVKKHVVDNRSTAAEAIASFHPVFPGMPIVLMAQDGSGRPTYYGREDISRFLATVPMRAIPWRDYTVN